MLAPGRYIIHAMVRYTSGGGFERFYPNLFSNMMRDSAQRELGGRARMTENLPFNPFVQTYKDAGWFTDDYYALLTIFLSVEQQLDESTIRDWISRAWGQSITGERLEFNESVRASLVRSLNACSSDRIPTPGPTENVFSGCMSTIVDPGATWATWNQYAWLQTFSGYQPWEHTDAPLTPAIPQAQPPPPPQVTPPPTPQTGQGQTGGTGTTPGQPGGLQPSPGGTTTSIWSEPGVKVAVGAAVVAVVGVLIWSIASEPKTTLRPALAGRRTNRRRTR